MVIASVRILEHASGLPSFFCLHRTLWEIRVTLPGYGTAAARAALPIRISVCSIFVCPNSGMAASVLGFLTCAQKLLQTIAHGGCTDTVRESALKVDTGKKIPCRPGDLNPRQYYAWLFSRTL